MHYVVAVHQSASKASFCSSTVGSWFFCWSILPYDRMREISFQRTRQQHQQTLPIERGAPTTWQFPPTSRELAALEESVTKQWQTPKIRRSEERLRHGQLENGTFAKHRAHIAKQVHLTALSNGENCGAINSVLKLGGTKQIQGISTTLSSCSLSRLWTYYIYYDFSILWCHFGLCSSPFCPICWVPGRCTRRPDSEPGLARSRDRTRTLVPGARSFFFFFK